MPAVLMHKRPSYHSAVDAQCASTATPYAAEMDTLRKRLIDRRRPGAASAIKRLEKLDRSMADLMTNAANFNLTNHKKTHGLEPMMRRYAFLKTNDLIAQLIEVMRHVANANTALELTDKNTALPPEHPRVTHVFEEVQKEFLRMHNVKLKSINETTKLNFDLIKLYVRACIDKSVEF